MVCQFFDSFHLQPLQTVTIVNCTGAPCWEWRSVSETINIQKCDHETYSTLRTRYFHKNQIDARVAQAVVMVMKLPGSNKGPVRKHRLVLVSKPASVTY